MKKKFIIIFLGILFLFFLIFGLFLLSQNTDNKFVKRVKDFTPVLIKDFLKKTIFYLPVVNRELVNLRKENSELKEVNSKLNFKNIGYENKIKTGNINNKIIKTDLNNYKLESFVLPFYDDEDIYNNKAKGYLEMYDDNLLVIFSSGKSIVVDKSKLVEKIFSYKQIKNNILNNNFFNTKYSWTGVKGIKIHNSILYLSITREIEKNCYNTSVLSAKVNAEFLDFKNFFISKECVRQDQKNTYTAYPSFYGFNGYQTGGTIQVNNKNVYLAHGDYNNWEKPQNENSIFGKILSISKKDMKYKILSIGHRNNQGSVLLSDKFLIVTEHGPKGGDEINIINLHEKKLANFGWPISSYGDHYDSVPLSSAIKKIAPLKKSHKKFGFTEPIFFFNESVGISQIVKNHYSVKNSFFISSLKNGKIYNIEFDKNFENPKIVEILDIGERIRDFIYDKDNNKYYLFLESSSELSILSKIY